MTESLSLFLSGILSATLLPGSSEALLVALLVQAKSNIYVLLAAATVGNVLGSVINWYLGRYLMHFRSRKWFPLSEHQIQRAQVWFSKYGVWSLLFAWLPIVGDPLTLVAGLLKVRFSLFLPLVFAGKLIRYTVVALVTLVWI